MDFAPVLGLVIFLMCGLALAFLAGVWWTVHRLTRPTRRTYANALAHGRPGEPDQLPPREGSRRTYQKWTVAWRGLDLPVWDFPGDGRPSTPVFIFTHGWGDSRIGAFTRAAALLPLASRCIAWDMPGHGDALGASCLGAHEHAALRAIIERVEGQAPIVLLGWSLGAGVSIAAASGWDAPASHRVIGVIAEAPYRHAITPARNVMRLLGAHVEPVLRASFVVLGRRLGVGADWARPGPFDRAQLARSVHCPLLVLHGALDAVSPPQDGRDIAACAPRGTFVELPDLGHHSMWTDPATSARAVDAVARFLDAADTPTTMLHAHR
jgi:pimeloyl-ACP methyl ester carboxylesterase